MHDSHRVLAGDPSQYLLRGRYNFYYPRCNIYCEPVVISSTSKGAGQIILQVAKRGERTRKQAELMCEWVRKRVE